MGAEITKQPHRVRTLLAEASAELAAAGIAEARIDAEVLLGWCLQKTRTAIYLAADDVVDTAVMARFHGLLERRRQREPLAYIIGEREFWSLSFLVSPAVLIPRPETEFLLEMVLARRNQAGQPGGAWLDLCCGSGVIAVVLARECGRPVIAADISAAALAVTQANCRRHRVVDRVALVQADGVSAFRDTAPFSLIVSNPPYIPGGDLEALQPEVSRHEPRLALDGGPDGLRVIATLAQTLPNLLAEGGDCFLEIGADQGDAVVELFTAGGCEPFYEWVQIYRDYAGRDRVAHLRRR